MIFSVSNDGIVWSLHFGPDSVPLTVKDLVEEVTITYPELPQSACNLLSQGQNLVNNHLASVPITPNQQGFMEMRD